MNTRAFIRKLRRYARRHDKNFDIKNYESKGSHRRVCVGDRNTSIPWNRNLKIGLIRAVLKQLHIQYKNFDES